MKLSKIFLTTILVFTLGAINPVQAEDKVIPVGEDIFIENETDFLAAAETRGENNTWIIKDNITLTKLHSAKALGNGSFIAIPSGTTIKGEGDAKNITFELGVTKLTKVFSALGDITIENLNIIAPFKSDPGKNAYQFTPTLISFSENSKNIVLRDSWFSPSAQSVGVDLEEAPHANFGIGLYFSSKNANVTFDKARISTGRLQFQSGSSGKVTFIQSLFGQSEFLHKDGIEDELIYVVDGKNWKFDADKETRFNLGAVLSDPSYFKILHDMIGDRFEFSHRDFFINFTNEIIAGKTTIKLSSTDLWAEHMVTEFLDNILSDDEKYGKNKNFQYAVTYGPYEKSYESDWHEPVDLEDGKPVPVGKHRISVGIFNSEIGLYDYFSSAIIVESTEDEIEIEKEQIKPKIEVNNPVVLEQFGDKKPVVTFPKGSFMTDVKIDFGPSTILSENLDTAIGFINKSLSKSKIGKTFTIDISALNDEGALVDAEKGALITVTVPIPKNLDRSKTLKVYYIDQNDYEAKELPTTLNADGTLTFLTPHFSNYMIAEVIEGEVEELPVPTPEPEPNPEPKPESETEPVVKPVEKPVVKDPTGPVLPPTGVSSSLAIGAPLAILGVLMIGLDQLKRYMKKLNN